MRRTEPGLILEKVLGSCEHRWLWCWNGEPSEGPPYDCACCITWPDDELYSKCGCICHERIEQMANLPHIKLWLLAAQSMKELPRFFYSYAEKLEHAKEVYALHKEQSLKFGNTRPCDCKDCQLARRDEETHKSPLNTEEDNHANASLQTTEN